MTKSHLDQVRNIINSAGKRDQLKKQYTQLVQKAKKNRAFLDSPNRTEAEILRYTPALEKLFRDIAQAAIALENAGVEMTKEEVLNGFKEFREGEKCEHRNR